MGIFRRKNVKKETTLKSKPKQQREDKPMAKPYESGDLAKDHAAAKEDLNRSSVHVSDSLRNAFDRMAKGVDAKHVPAMRSLQKRFDDLLEDVNELAAKEEKKSTKGEE